MILNEEFLRQRPSIEFAHSDSREARILNENNHLYSKSNKYDLLECTPKIERCVSLMNITYAVTAGNSKENLLFFCFANNETKLTKRINFRVNFD